ncbi:MAG TPA: hypothetical protein VLX92_07000 [Kofleriaceae bacterium]|nr:hypothetical protein [Kofleriaceae bacterium]
MRRLDQRGDLRPRDRAVEPHADPAQPGHVRRQVIDLRIAVDQHGLDAGLGRAHQREPAVVVVLVREHRELVLADEPRRHAVARPLGHVGQRETGGAELGERGGGRHEAAC